MYREIDSYLEYKEYFWGMDCETIFIYRVFAGVCKYCFAVFDDFIYQWSGMLFVSERCDASGMSYVEPYGANA